MQLKQARGGETVRMLHDDDVQKTNPGLRMYNLAMEIILQKVLHKACMAQFYKNLFCQEHVKFSDLRQGKARSRGVKTPKLDSSLGEMISGTKECPCLGLYCPTA